MKTYFYRLAAILMLLAINISIGLAQTAGAIGGTVVDQTGAVIPNATVVVKGEGGQEFTVTTSSNGTYRVPSVPAGFYTVTITGTGFKTSVRSNVKVDVGTPTAVDVALEVGDVSQVVEVTTGGEVLQTQTATIATNIQGRQITETPIASRDALDLVNLLPGVNTVGAPRRSSINGLPKGAISITIDGVDVQDNQRRSADGYFTYVRPRIDAIDEVTVSTANPGSESSGDGAVQIKFVTRRGTNDYRGGLYYQHRDEGLNANYWYTNRDVAPIDGKAPRQKIRLNQYGGRLGGPLPFLLFGEGDKWFHSGKDKAFFFVNYEEFRLPESMTRTRTILTPEAQAGNFSYITSSGTQTVNLYNIAAKGNNSSIPTTADPTIATILARIRAETAKEGSIAPITNAAGAVTDPNRLRYTFTPVGGQVRKFLALRFDFNLTKNHSVENVLNKQKFNSIVDFLNSYDPRFPGFPQYSQNSIRNSNTTALRSNFTKNIVNEVRFNKAWGPNAFAPELSADDFAYQGGFYLNFGSTGASGAGITEPTNVLGATQSESPNWEITDSLTWVKGSHTINIGGQFKRVQLITNNLGRAAATVSFGLSNSNDPAFGLFTTCTVAAGTPIPANCNLPNASTTQLNEARGLYAALAGRVSSYANTAYLNESGQYELFIRQRRQAQQDTYGLYAQDSWRIRPGLTLNYGLRWQPQGGYVVITENYSRLEDPSMVYGVSGQGNIFKPGTLTGTAPRVVGLKSGEELFPTDYNNFAPSIGVVWSPNYSEGILRTIFGESGKSVFRAGYSRAFVREGTALVANIVGSNPGGTASASRSTSIANSFTVGTNFRDAGNPNLTPNTFAATPAYPLALTSANSTNGFDPNLKTGYADSFSVGYQRELDKNTVVEVRYVGTRGRELLRQTNVNEYNTIENGFAAEFKLAQQNLYANIAAGRCIVAGQTPTTNPGCQFNFAFFGPNTGTSPLPIMLSYFNPPATYLPNNPAGVAGTPYTAANFANSSLLAFLDRNNARPISFASSTSFENDVTRRQNAINNGRPINFFQVNPTTPGFSSSAGSFLVENSASSWYDSAQIEFRRRLSHGLRVQASYVFGRAMTDSFNDSTVVYSVYTQRENGLELARNVAVHDIRHAFKFDATYDLPFGKGRAFFTNSNGFVNSLVGGFTLLPTIRWQSGSPFVLGNVQLVGMTAKELQKEIRVRKGSNAVTYLPDDIILNTQRAFDLSITSATGYGTQYEGGGPPQGRFIAPAGYNNCQQRYAGECGFNNLILYGPSFFKFDLAVSKKFNIGEKRNIELRANFLDVLNMPNFRIGGWGADSTVAGTDFGAVGGSTFGQLATGSAYRDVSTTNDPGGRIVDLILRINF